MTIVVSLSLESTIICARKDFRDRLDEYVFSIMGLGIISAIIWLLVVQAVSPLVSGLFSVDPRYLLAMSLYLVFFPVSTTFQAWERFSFRYKGTVAVSIALSVGIAFCSVSLAMLLPDPLDGVIFGKVLPAVLVGVLILLRMVAQARRVDARFWPYALRIAWPFIPHLLSMNLLGAVGKVLVTRMCGAEANALYSLANNCGLIVSILVTSLNGAFSPWLGDMLCECRYEEIRKASKPYVTSFLALAFMVCLTAPEVLLVLGGELYLPAAPAIPPVALGCALQFIYSMYVNVEQYEKRTVGMALASASAAGVCIATDFFLIPLVGYAGAAYGSLLGYVWLLAVHMVLVRRMGMLHVYDTGFMVISVTLASLAMLASGALYSLPAVRYALICVMGVGVARLALRLRDGFSKKDMDS